MKLINWNDFKLFYNCPKSFYLNITAPEQKRDFTELEKNYEKESKELMDMARTLFPACEEDLGIGKRDFNDNSRIEEAAKDTLHKLKTESKPALYNAVFMSEDGLVARADMVFKRSSGYELVLVIPDLSSDLYSLMKKNSKKAAAKKIMAEAAFLKSVAGKAGIMGSVSIVMINPLYTRGNTIEVKRFLEIFKVDSKIVPFMQEAQKTIEGIKSLYKEDSDVLIKEEPKVFVGGQCKSKSLYVRECPFYKYCWKNVGEDSITNIPRISDKKKALLESENIESIFDIPKGHSELTNNQQLEIRKIVRGKERGEPYVRKVRLKMLLNRLQYPLYHLDFETYSPMIPRFKGTKSYDTIPYQYSLHIEHEDGTLEHKEFLNIEDQDPRADFVNSLIADVSGKKGNVVVYNRGFESGVMMTLADNFPNLRPALENIVDRIFDLMVPFQKKHFFDYKMYFSYSLKAVLPALVPGLSHSDMDVSDGLKAMGEYFNLMSNVQQIDALDKEMMELNKPIMDLKVKGARTQKQIKSLESKLKIKETEEDKNNLEELMQSYAELKDEYLKLKPEIEEALDPLEEEKANLVVEREKIIEMLLKYCELDTYSMVKILEVLFKGKADLSDWEF